MCAACLRGALTKTVFSHQSSQPASTNSGASKTAISDARRGHRTDLPPQQTEPFGMSQLLQIFPFSLAFRPRGEHYAGQSLPVEQPLRSKTVSPHRRRTAASTWAAQVPASRLIRIEHAVAELCKLPGYLALATRHSARNSDDSHELVDSG